jgi:hypothetical protein
MAAALTSCSLRLFASPSAPSPSNRQLGSSLHLSRAAPLLVQRNGGELGRWAKDHQGCTQPAFRAVKWSGSDMTVSLAAKALKL